MLTIRLQRVGRRNHAEFRVVVTEHTTAPQSGKYLEALGHYNPHTNALTIDADRAKYWMNVGAQVSPTLHNLLVTNKIIKGDKKNVLPRKTPIVKKQDTTEAGAAGAPAVEGTAAENPAEQEESAPAAA